jgi:lipopolysaccharide/colanic/teichoic acid biosynthesis glycosyltransferase
MKETVDINVELKDEDRISILEAFLKRCFDIVFSLLAMIIFLIPIGVIYVMIKIEDGGNVIFKQERIGLCGRPFVLYKFRSMKMDAETNNQPQLCEEDDSRLTKIGAFLRNHHLDEFPQLWNILKGDMSFVGPRPERKYFIDKIMAIDANYQRLYQLRPGIFSMATLYNGYTNTMEKMLRRMYMDIDYLEKRSFMLDLKIIWLTTWSIILGRKF